MVPLRAGDLPGLVLEVEQALLAVSSLLEVGQTPPRREMRFPAMAWDGRG